jgi:hypothetical protein
MENSMKRVNGFVLILVIVAGAMAAAESVVNFEKNGFKPALAKAAELNKLVLLDFYTDT